MARLRPYGGRFSGFRVNVESVPRLPTRPAFLVLADRRRHFVFWRGMYDEKQLAAVAILEPAGHDAVRLRQLTGDTLELVAVIRLAFAPLPKGGGRALLYQCPICSRPRRFLYPLAISDSRCWWHEFQCHACARLLFASQGRYRGGFDRAVTDGARSRGHYAPLPRSAWDPEVTTDPEDLAREFPGQFVLEVVTNPGAASPSRKRAQRQVLPTPKGQTPPADEDLDVEITVGR